MRIGADTRALVTGASSGIGLACAEALAARGATVGMLARNEEKLAAHAARIGAEALVADVTDAASLAGAIERFAGGGAGAAGAAAGDSGGGAAGLHAGAPGIDLLVANAGIAHYGPFADQPFEQTEQMVETNVLGVIRSVHLALPGMLDRARGHIVVVSSGAGLRSFPWAAAYGATKAAELGFAEALRHELSGTGVSVSSVLPGEVQTSLHDHQPERMPDWRRPGEAVPASVVATAVLQAAENDRRRVCVPRQVRLLGLNGIAPKLTDRILSLIRGGSAAPRRRE